MFRCHFCQQVTPPKTTRHTVVIETREKTYAVRHRDNKRGYRSREENVQDRGGAGVEIMKEVSACPTCAAKQHEVKVNAAVVEPVETPEEVGAEQAADAPATEAAPAEAAEKTEATEAAEKPEASAAE